jgi:hypothetical protein
MNFLPTKVKLITYSGRGSSDFPLAVLFSFSGAWGIQPDPPPNACRYCIFVSSSALIYLYRDYGRLQQWTMFRAVVILCAGAKYHSSCLQLKFI